MYAGTQLGGGHARAAAKKLRRAIMNDFNEKFDVYLNTATTMRDQVIQARVYCKRNYVNTVSSESLIPENSL